MERLRKEKMKRIIERMNYPDKPVEINDKTISEVIAKYPVVVIDFWASWCTPCRIIAPMIEELAKRYHGRVVFAKLNVDENRITAMRFRIMGIPTLLIFKNKNLVDRIVGVKPIEEIEHRLRRVLGD